MKGTAIFSTLAALVIPIVIFVPLVLSAQSHQKPVVHRVLSEEGGVSVNAYIVETERGLIVIDATLTSAGGKALRARTNALGKPVVAVLLTHAHPDHYGGLTAFLGDSKVPVIALESIDGVMRANDPEKAVRVQGQKLDVWPAQRRMPTRVVRSGSPLTLAGATFTPFAFGPGEAPADGYWLMAGARPTVFIGDIAYNDFHLYLGGDERKSYTAQWLRNIDVVEARHPNAERFYPGHGAPGGPDMLEWTRRYLQSYRTNVRDIAKGRPKLDPAEERELEGRMRAYAPDAPDVFIKTGFGPVALELSFEPPLVITPTPPDAAAAKPGVAAPGVSRPDVMIAAPDLNWTKPDPAAPYSLAKLWGDFNSGQAGVLLRLPGGFKGPVHAHTSDYRAVIISGTWVHVVTETSEGTGVRLGPGSYYTQRANQMHADECVSSEPCVFFRFTEADYKTYTPADPTPR